MRILSRVVGWLLVLVRYNAPYIVPAIASTWENYVYRRVRYNAPYILPVIAPMRDLRMPWGALQRTLHTIQIRVAAISACP